MNNRQYFTESYPDGGGYDDEVLEYEDELLEDFDDEFDDDYDGYGDSEYDDYPESYNNESLNDYEKDYDSEKEIILEGFRNVLHEDFQDLSQEELEVAYENMMESLSPAEAFSFGNIFKSVAKVGKKIIKNPMVRGIAKKGLPVFGKTLGAIYGGPVGAALGGRLGSLAGQAFGGAKRTSSRRKSKGRSRIPATIAPTSPIGGSNAAAQFLQMTQNPILQQALGALSMGANGKQNVKLPGGQSFSLGAAANMLSQLAGKMVKDAEEIQNFNESNSSYLTDSEGNFKIDPFEAENRSQALYETIVNAENEGFDADSVKDYPWSKYFPFSTGRKLLVEYETFFRNIDVGKAFVVERTNDKLSIRIHTMEIDLLGNYIPETKIFLTIWYSGFEEGNKAHVVVNGKRYTDKNIKIKSGNTSREIYMSINLMGFKVNKITLIRDKNESMIKFKAGGENRVLILSNL